MAIAFTPHLFRNRKECCNCEYFDAERKLEFVNGRLYLIRVQISPQGRCLVHSNTLATHSALADLCKSYKHWHKLPELNETV